MNEDIVTTELHRFVGFLPLPCLESSSRKRFRVVAVEDMPWHGVKAGDVGGFVDSPSCMSQMSWVGGQASVQRGSLVSNCARVDDNARVNLSTVAGNAVVCGSAALNKGCAVSDDVCVGGNAGLYKSSATGSARIHGNALALTSHVKDNAILCGFTSVKNSVVAGDAFITGLSALFSSTVGEEYAMYTGLYVDNKPVSLHNMSQHLSAVDSLLVETQLDDMREAYAKRLAMRDRRDDDAD